MKNNDDLIRIVAKGVAYIADRTEVPRQTECIHTAKALRTKPPAGIDYEGIDQLVAAGLATCGQPYTGTINVSLTYAGHRRNLELTGWIAREYENWKQRYAKYLCCDKAIPGHCVCLVMTRCSDHGTHCNGSHD